MFVLAAPQPVTSLDGVTFDGDALVRLAAASGPLDDAVMDLSPRLADDAWGSGQPMVREASPETEAASVYWWPVDDAEARWLLLECAGMATDAAEDPAPPAPLITADRPGIVYVMRSPAMERDIYKVGRTVGDPEKRARELSAATGVAAEFLVVEQWEVGDCVVAERLCHQRLRPYRLSGRREFFRAPYRVLRNTIEGVVQDLAASLPFNDRRAAS